VGLSLRAWRRIFSSVTIRTRTFVAVLLLAAVAALGMADAADAAVRNGLIAFVTRRGAVLSPATAALLELAGGLLKELGEELPSAEWRGGS
jgi:hypothetical protein